VAVVISTTARGEIWTWVLSHGSQACTTRPLRPAEARGREQVAQGCYSTERRPEIELATIELRVQRPNHQTAEPPIGLPRALYSNPTKTSL